MTANENAGTLTVLFCLLFPCRRSQRFISDTQVDSVRIEDCLRPDPGRHGNRRWTLENNAGRPLSTRTLCLLTPLARFLACAIILRSPMSLWALPRSLASKPTATMQDPRHMPSYRTNSVATNSASAATAAVQPSPMGPSSSESPSAALLRLMRRRVPPEKRQRTEMSCDWCKKKRCKCLRSSTADTCRACSEIGRQCTTTEPRKRRLYGSLSGPPGQQGHPPSVATAPPITSSASSSSSSSSHSPLPDPAMNGPSAMDGGIHDLGIDLTTTDPQLLLLRPPPPPSHQPRQPAFTYQAGNNDTPPSSETTLSAALVVAQKKMMPPPPLPQPPHHQQKRLCDERLFEDALGFPRYIGPLGSYTLLVKLWEVMAVWCAPMTHRDSAQTMGQSQPMLRLGDAHGDDARQIDLPQREVADVLVALFFDKVHCDFPLFHRALFQASYENMWAPPSPSPPHSGPRTNHHHAMSPDTEPAWLMCLSMVFVLGLEAASAQSSAIRRLVGNTARREALKARYLAKAKEVLPDVISGSMLVHVQALMLYCRYLHITRNRNACWNLTGAAIRVAVAIGLHRNGVHGRCSPLERELRRRIWWTLYAFERIECSSLGRTSAIDDAECNVGVPTEGLLDMSDILPLGYVGAHAELMTLLGSICKHQYGGSSSSNSGAASASSSTGGVDVPLDQIDFALASSAALDRWHAQLPGHMRLHADSPTSHQRAILLLHVQHHYTVTLLCRPFLLALVAKNKPATGSKGASSSSRRQHQMRDSSAADEPGSTRETASSSFAASPLLMFARKCIDAAKAAVAVLDCLFRAGLFNSKTWWDVYFIEASCMVLALGRFVNDKDLRNDVGILDALRTCIHILKECKEFSPTMHRFAVVTTDFAQALVADAPREKKQEQPQRQTQRQIRDHRVSYQIQHDEGHGQQSQRQPNSQQQQHRQNQQHQHGQHQPFNGQPLQQPFICPDTTGNAHPMRTAHPVREVDDLGGDHGSASTAGSQSGSSPDDSFIPVLPGQISGVHDPTGGSMLPDPFSMPWNLADISQLWGDWVEPPEHGWQQG